MLKKNGITIGALALLLSVGLAGSAFASNQSYIELDESDYSGNSTAMNEVVQNDAQEPAITGWVNLIELDESDYNDGRNGFDAKQTHKPVQAEIAQNKTTESINTGWVNLIELDEGDYEGATPADASKRVLCAGADGSGSMSNCG